MNPPAADNERTSPPVDDFLELASLHYGVRPGSGVHDPDYRDGPERRKRAARLLERHPDLAGASIHTAVVCGERALVERFLAAYPAEATRKGGREQWEPLLFLCYGRLPLPAGSDEAVAIATALLDHGADTNAFWGYHWDDTFMPFSASCGAVGDGESGPIACPPHPHAEALITLLLDRGADPNQGQALYNTMLRGDDDRWLRVLLSRGLTATHPISWQPNGSGPGMLDYLLAHAVAQDQRARAALLLAHGASPERQDGPSLYEVAVQAGNLEMAELLVRHGARRREPTGEDVFRAACMRRDATVAKAMLKAAPARPDAAGLLLVDVAARRDLVEVAHFLLDLGVPVNFEKAIGGYRALHNAACTNSAKVAQLLIDRGAEVDTQDGHNRATPLGWALHTRSSDTTRLLAGYTRDVFTLTAGGLIDALRALLSSQRDLANAVIATSIGLGHQSGAPGETSLFVLPEDEDLAMETARLLLAFGADPTVRGPEGTTAAEKARARGLEAVAELLRRG